MKLPPALQAAFLQSPRLADLFLSEIYVSKVVEDLVGQPMLADPLVNRQGRLTMIDRAGVVPGGARGNAQRHMGVRHSNQAFGVGRDGQRLFVVAPRLLRLAEQ